MGQHLVVCAFGLIFTDWESFQVRGMERRWSYRVLRFALAPLIPFESHKPFKRLRALVAQGYLDDSMVPCLVRATCPAPSESMRGANSVPGGLSAMSARPCFAVAAGLGLALFAGAVLAALWATEALAPRTLRFAAAVDEAFEAAAAAGGGATAAGPHRGGGGVCGVCGSCGGEATVAAAGFGGGGCLAHQPVDHRRRTREGALCLSEAEVYNSTLVLYAKANRFLMRYVAPLPRAEVAELTRLFDRNEDGVMDRAEFAVFACFLWHHVRTSAGKGLFFCFFPYLFLFVPSWALSHTHTHTT